MGAHKRRVVALTLVALAVLSFDLWSASPPWGAPVFADARVGSLRGRVEGGALAALTVRPAPDPSLAIRVLVADGERLPRELDGSGPSELLLPQRVLPGQAFILTLHGAGGSLLGEASVRLPPAIPEGEVDLDAYRLPGVVDAEAGTPFHLDLVGQRPLGALARVELAAIAALLALAALLLARSRRALIAGTGAKHRHVVALLAILALFAAGAQAAAAHYRGTLLLNATQELGHMRTLLEGRELGRLTEAGYTVLGAVWLAATGSGSPAGMEGAVMALGLVLSLAALAATWGAASSLARDPDAGLCAAALLASTPLFLKYAVTVQRDIASTAFSMLALWAASVRPGRGGSAPLHLAIAALGLAAYTVSVHLLLVPALAVLAAGRATPGRSDAAALLLLALCLLPLAPVMGGVLGSTGSPLGPGLSYMVHNASHLAAFWLGRWHHSLAIPLLAAFGLSVLGGRDRLRAAAVAAAFVLPLAFLAVHKVPVSFCDQDRHLLYSYPLLALAAGVGFRRLVRGRPSDGLAALLLVYLVLVHLGLALGPLDLRRCL